MAHQKQLSPTVSFRSDEKNLSSHVDFSQKRAREVFFRLKTAVNYGAVLTETGRPRIQRQAWWLTSAANVYDFGHVALFVGRKR